VSLAARSLEMAQSKRSLSFVTCGRFGTPLTPSVRLLPSANYSEKADFTALETLLEGKIVSVQALPMISTVA
jgi:hypothetical protein